MMMWTLCLAASAISLCVGGVALFSDRARGRKRCPRCGYCLATIAESQIPYRCSECGRIIRRASDMYKTMRRLKLGLTSLALASILAWPLPKAIADGWLALVPGPLVSAIADNLFADTAQASFDSACTGEFPRTEWEATLAMWYAAQQMSEFASSGEAESRFPPRSDEFVRACQYLLSQESYHGSKWLTRSWAKAAVDLRSPGFVHFLTYAHDPRPAMPLLWNAASDADGSFATTLIPVIVAIDPTYPRAGSDEQIAAWYGDAFDRPLSTTSRWRLIASMPKDRPNCRAVADQQLERVLRTRR